MLFMHSRIRWLLFAVVAFVAILSLLPSLRPLFAAPATQQQTEYQMTPQEAAFDRLKAASESPFNIYMINDFPQSVQGAFSTSGATSYERAASFLEQYRTLYLQDDPNLALIPRAVVGDAEDTVVFDQTYAGIKVDGAQLVVLLSGEKVIGTIGSLLPQGMRINVTPGITDAEAKRIVRADLRIPDPMGTLAELRIADPGLTEEMAHVPRLIWRVMVLSGDPWEYWIDAHTGEIVSKFSRIDEAFDFTLQDANGTSAGWGNSCYQATWTDDTIANNDFDPAYNGDADAVNAFQSIPTVYNYFWNTYSWDSWDDSGTEIDVYVHADVDNAQWSRHCNLIEFRNGYTGLSVLFHEFTHGVSEARDIGDWDYYHQQGALNEAYSDIIGALALNYWVFGDDRTGSSNPIRDLTQPVNMSDDYQSCNQSMDAGCVHNNSLIFSHAVQLFTNGGAESGMVIDAIGDYKSTYLMWGALHNTPGSSQFIGARNVVVNVASAWAQNEQDNSSMPGYGFTWHDVCQVRNAFAAVGIGSPDFGCDGYEDTGDQDGDGIIQGDNCPLTSNLSQTDYDGDGFGDACDNDYDNDGHVNGQDNCPYDANSDQADPNYNGVGTACDPTEDDDYDNDGSDNFLDNCPFDFNPYQEDFDYDGIGDACDVADDDGDDLGTDVDNCPMVVNPNQGDTDQDGIGDACDQCPINADQVLGQTYFENPVTHEVTIIWMVPDSDEDGVPDACDYSVSVGELPNQPPALSPDCIPMHINVKAVEGSFPRIPIWLNGFSNPLKPAEWEATTFLPYLQLPVDEGMLPPTPYPTRTPDWRIAATRTPEPVLHGQVPSQSMTATPDTQFPRLITATPILYAPQESDPNLLLPASDPNWLLPYIRVVLEIDGLPENAVAMVIDTDGIVRARTKLAAPPDLILPQEGIGTPPEPVATQKMSFHWLGGVGYVLGIYFVPGFQSAETAEITVMGYRTSNGETLCSTDGESSTPTPMQTASATPAPTLNATGTLMPTFTLTTIFLPTATLIPDRDGDDVPDPQDACADTPGPAGNGGCPVPTPIPDRDGDGFPDDGDRCPDTPGTQDGCPTPTAIPDSDGDGIPDPQDACPGQPGGAANAGCPPPTSVPPPPTLVLPPPPRDRDGDGVPDDQDNCPDTPGPLNGCPIIVPPHL